jgi:Na+/H+ antiporter NhaD/arsenite permease-like protein
MRNVRRRVVRAMRRYSVPFAWTIFLLSIVAFITIVSSIWKVDDPVTAGLGALLLVWAGYDAIQEAEDVND